MGKSMIIIDSRSSTQKRNRQQRFSTFFFYFAFFTDPRTSTCQIFSRKTDKNSRNKFNDEIFTFSAVALFPPTNPLIHSRGPPGVPPVEKRWSIVYFSFRANCFHKIIVVSFFVRVRTIPGKRFVRIFVARVSYETSFFREFSLLFFFNSTKNSEKVPRFFSEYRFFIFNITRRGVLLIEKT